MLETVQLQSGLARLNSWDGLSWTPTGFKAQVKNIERIAPTCEFTIGRRRRSARRTSPARTKGLDQPRASRSHGAHGCHRAVGHGLQAFSLSPASCAVHASTGSKALAGKSHRICRLSAQGERHARRSQSHAISGIGSAGTTGRPFGPCSMGRRRRDGEATPGRRVAGRFASSPFLPALPGLRSSVPFFLSSLARG